MIPTLFLRTIAVGAALTLGVALSSGPASADPVEDFYRGKTIDLIIGYSAGGGYDRYGRLLAQHIGRHIPGNPTVVPRNLPGAGSLVAVNHLYDTADADGTVFGTFSRGLPMAPLLFDEEGLEFDATRFNWIGSLNNEVSVCMAWHTASVSTWEEMQEVELITAGSGTADDTATMNILSNVLGAKLRIITGYPGSSEMMLAMERGEVDGFCGVSWSSAKSRKPEWIAENKVNLLVQMAMEKHADLPDVPLVMDFAETEEERQILTLIFARQTMGRPFAAPPGVPAERVEALRAAFEATVRDPEFLKAAEEARLEINPVSGPEIDALLGAVYQTPPEVVARTRAAIQN